MAPATSQPLDVIGQSGRLILLLAPVLSSRDLHGGMHVNRAKRVSRAPSADALLLANLATLEAELRSRFRAAA